MPLPRVCGGTLLALFRHVLRFVLNPWRSPGLIYAALAGWNLLTRTASFPGI